MTPAAPTAIPILLYHSVAEQDDSGYSAFTVTPAAFGEHIRAIEDSGRVAMTVSELAEALRGARALPARPVLVTFDDGHAEIPVAVELLLGRGLGASVFVTAGAIESPGMVTRHDLVELSALGRRVEIGAHSVTHRRLDELSKQAAEAEISVSKRAVENVVLTPVRSFAYPHGAYDRRVRSCVVNAGFTAAAAVKNALSHSLDDPYALARVTIGARTSARDLECLLAGEGAPRAWAGERARTRAYRGVRRLRRRLMRPLAGSP
ncbi:MAG TPA: polysaccharide deacetylase family protein [Solirubrobacteraceae bacterium]|nr:polysaccharide deacetylase family protein [Solirubrobacteraceae bacterium]